MPTLSTRAAGFVPQMGESEGDRNSGSEEDVDNIAAEEFDVDIVAD